MIPSTWVAIDQDADANIVATKAAIADHRHFVTRITISFDIAVVDAVVATVKSGSTVIDQFEVPIAAIGAFVVRDYTSPRRGGTNEAITITVPDPGSSVVCTAVVAGFTRPA